MRRSSPFLIALLAILVTFAVASPAAAYYTVITGQLRDFDNNAWPYGGTVEVFNCSTLVSIATTSTFDVDGNFTINLAPPLADEPLCIEVRFNADPVNGYTPGVQTKGPYANRLASGDEGTLNIGVFKAEGPLSVRLASLTATATASQIKVEWVSASEIDNLGFNVYRSTNAEAPSQQLNSALIASQAAGSSESYAYEWVDAAVQPGTTYYYWLEDVDASGERTMSGPVSASPEAPTAVELNTLTAAAPTSGMLPLLGLGLLGVTAAGVVAWRRRR